MRHPRFCFNMFVVLVFVGVLIIPARTLSAFEHRVFLTGSEIDEGDQPDETALASFYYVLGYSGSRTQVKVSPQTRQINKGRFRLALLCL